MRRCRLVSQGSVGHLRGPWLITCQKCFLGQDKISFSDLPVSAIGNSKLSLHKPPVWLAFICGLQCLNSFRQEMIVIYGDQCPAQAKADLRAVRLQA